MSPPSKPKRVYSESQLDKKRLSDRLKHRENRRESKHRLERIERDVADIRAMLQSLPLAPPSQTQAPPQADVICTNCEELLAPELAQRSSHGAYSDSSTPATASFPSAAQLSSKDLTSQLHTPASQLQTSWTIPIPTYTTRLINCLCGFQHLDRFDSIDQCSMTNLYACLIPYPATQVGPGILPRTPSLPSMLLHSTDENVATFLITGFFRQYQNKGMVQLMSFYLLGYRYMRWQLSPCEETIRDVPTWLLPTETQKLNPHSVIVDYIPWPRLRDYLCTRDGGDLQRSVHLYLDSIEFIWPLELPLFAQGDGGQMSVSVEFEMAVGSLAHWRMGPPWSEEFPHLMHLVVS